MDPNEREAEKYRNTPIAKKERFTFGDKLQKNALNRWDMIFSIFKHILFQKIYRLILSYGVVAAS